MALSARWHPPRRLRRHARALDRSASICARFSRTASTSRPSLLKTDRLRRGRVNRSHPGSGHCSAADPRLQVRRVPVAVNRDFRRRVVDLSEIGGGYGYVGGTEVLLEPVQFGRAGDRHDRWLLREEPGERELRRCGPLPHRDSVQQVDQRLVRRDVLPREPWERGPAEVTGLERRRLIDLAGEKALAEWAE